MGLRSNFLAVVLRDLPNADSKIDRSNPRFGELQGGQIAPGKWARYETGFGSSCATTVVGWGLEAGLPADLLNAAPPGGSGFKIGDHFPRLENGAKAHGWWHTPTRGVLPNFRPGDILFLEHGGPSGAHTGVALSTTPSADGQSLVVETGDGGQNSAGPGDIHRNVRTFDTQGRYSTAAGGSSGTLTGWISVGGDEADATVDEGTPSAPPGEGDDGPSLLPALAFAVGGGLVLWAAGKYVAHNVEPEWQRRVREHEAEKARQEKRP